MSFKSVAAKDVILRLIGVVTIAALVAVGVINEFLVHAQSPKTAAKPTTPSQVRPPDESAGLDGIVQTLISAFDHADIVALGEAHGRCGRSPGTTARNCWTVQSAVGC